MSIIIPCSLTTNDYYSGTTILAVEFEWGVVLGADSRTSCRAYVSNRVANKLTRITNHIYCCRSGSAAQTQNLCDIVRGTMGFYQHVSKETCLVRDAAVQFRNMIYGARKKIMASVIVAGWDSKLGGQVYTVPLSGLLLREKCAIGGSGGAYVQGYVHSRYSPTMSQEDALDMVKCAIRLAIARDCSSGGIVRMALITRDGMKGFIYDNKDNALIKEANKRMWSDVFDD